MEAAHCISPASTQNFTFFFPLHLSTQDLRLELSSVAALTSLLSWC